MFGRNTVASIIVFAFDILLLWGLVALLDVAYVPAAVIAYAIAMSLFYVIARKWVFPDSDQSVARGFVYFLVNVGIGFLVMLAVYWSLIHFVELHYLIARLAASAVSGIVIFLLNAVFNFKEL
jgi:putative flippase GtrA